MTKQRLIIFSPILVILIEYLVIRAAQPALGVWAWAPCLGVYWISIALLVLWGGGKAAVRGWMRPSQGRWWWSGLAILLALPALLMIGSWRLLQPVYVWVPWLIVGLLNPFLEEFYWRGLLLDATRSWSAWISIPGFALLFTLHHLFGIAVTTPSMSSPVFLINTFVIGTLFGLIYRKTNSLRWLIASHVMSDLFGMSVVIFLNLFVPPG
jgi:membrane protease YdiL (CAAX protease family)